MFFSLTYDVLLENSKYRQTPSYMGLSYTDSHIQTLYSVTNVSTHAVPCFHLCSMPGIGTIFSGTQAVATTRALGKIAKKAKFVFGPPISLMHFFPPPGHPVPNLPMPPCCPSDCPKPPKDYPFLKCPVIQVTYFTTTITPIPDMQIRFESPK